MTILLKNKILLFVFLLVLAPSLKAQLYTISGKVTGKSIEPLAFVSVNVKDHEEHQTATNEKGEFKLQLYNGKYTLVFTFLGYKPLKQDVIVNNANVSLNILLEEDQSVLNEVEINSKYVDPARGLVQKVIKTKGKYIQNAYQCELYVKASESKNQNKSRKDSIEAYKSTSVDSSKVEEKRKKIKSLSKKDSLENFKNKMPVYDDLNMAEVVIKKSFEYPNKLKEERLAYTPRGDIESLFYLYSNEGEFNFYENAVYCPSISEMPFLSPLSTTGLLMYKYKTIKVFNENGKRIFRIKVEPTAFANSLVSGEMEIIDTLYCLRSFNFSLPKHQLAEYKSFDAQAHFVPYDDSLYRPDKMEFNYKIGNKKSGSNGRTVVYIDNFKYEKSFAKKHFNSEVSATLEEAYKKDTSFWKEARKEPLTDKELKFIRITDSIKTARSSKVYLDSIDREENKVTIPKLVWYGQTHYNRAKELRFSFPTLVSMVQYNIGGFRLNADFGVNKKFENKRQIFANINANYGVLNKDVLGSVFLYVLYNPFKRGGVYFRAGKDYNFLNSNDSYLARFRTANFYITEHATITHSIELMNGLYWDVTTGYSTNRSIYGFQNDTVGSLLFDNYKHPPQYFKPYDAFYLTNTLSYTPYQKYIREPKEKIILGSKYPTLSVSHKKGVPGLFNSAVNFDYLEFAIRQDIDFGFFGIFKYRLSTGKYYNARTIKAADYTYQARVGFPFFADPLNSFQALEKSYITLDRFYAAHVFHRFNGALVNKIPYFKKLQIVESAGAGALYSPENNLTYFEFFAGLEKNIKLFRQTCRIGVFWVNAKTNNYPFRSDFRFTIEVYDNVFNKWNY